MSEKLKQLDLDNVDKSFEEIQFLINQVSGIFEKITFYYMGRKTSLQDLNKFKKYLSLRNLIEYRLHCILYHLTFLLDVQKGFQERIDEDPLNEEEQIKGMVLGREQCLALFDSIIFHTISMYDYLANLIEYISGKKYTHSLKWNGLLNTLRNADIEIDLSLKELLIDIHSSFINRLYNYRSDVIHKRADSSRSEFSMDLMNDSFKLSIGAPIRFCNIFSDLKQLSKNNQLSLNYVTIWLMKKSYRIVGDILNKIKELEEFKSKSRI